MESNFLTIALWDDPTEPLIRSGFHEGLSSGAFAIRKGSADQCERWLRSGEVDVSLLPSMAILRDVGAFDILPAVAVSSWGTPYCSLVSRCKIGDPINSIALHPRNAQEALVARIVLKEHYGMTPELMPVDRTEARELLASDSDAVLLVGGHFSTEDPDLQVYDLGQEWYELVNYPMVWGLFAVRKGEADPAVACSVRDAVQAADRSREPFVASADGIQEIEAYFEDNLRLRFDDLAVASLTNFREYLFYYGITADVPDLPLYVIPSEEDDDESQS